MDSLYEIPRRPPAPCAAPSNRPMLVPCVPEVSIIGSSNATTIKKLQSNTYGELGYHNKKTKILTENSFNIVSQTETYKTHNSKATLNDDKVQNKENFQNHVKNGSTRGKTFQELYLANMPCQQLDLSILDVPAYKKPPESFQMEQGSKPSKLVCSDGNDVPKTYLEYREKLTMRSLAKENQLKKLSHIASLKYSARPESLTSEFQVNSDNASYGYNNEKQNTPISPPLSKYVEKIDNNALSLCTSNNEEPSLRDLLILIKKQNEQIANLQEQMLLLQKQTLSTQPSLPQHVYHKKQMSNNCSINVKLPKINPAPANNVFSIDLTNFEVSIRPTQPFQPHSANCGVQIPSMSGRCCKSSHKNGYDRNTKYVTSKIHHQKIQEITESSESAVDNTQSNCLQTNDDALLLNLQDSLRIGEDCPSPEPSIRINMSNYQSSEEEEDHLCSNIVSMDKRNVEKNDDFENLTVKQFLLKYLPDEQLVNVVKKQFKNICEQNTSRPGKFNLPTNCPDYSMATLQYMKKYNLIGTGTKNTKQEQDDKHIDITALKQQPKLL